MAAQIIICQDHREASLRAAELVAQALLEKPESTVTFAAGDTPLACYRELIRRQEKGELSLAKARYIGLDEWLGLGPQDEGSCIASMNQGFYHPAQIPRERIFAFDGRHPDPEAEAQRMQDILAKWPLELAVLGVGVNGHIGFNEPGDAAQGDFALVPLSETTQRVGRKYFQGRPTPRGGATITLEALGKAKRVVILATGAAKREAVARVLAGENVENGENGQDSLPVCVFLHHPGAVYVLDEEAAGGVEAEHQGITK